MRISNVFFFAIALALVANTGFSQSNYYVDLTNGSNYWNGLSPIHTFGSTGPKSTIQATVNTAGSGDIINITDENYKESVTLDKNLTLRAPHGTVIGDITITNNSVVTLSSPFGYDITVSGALTISNGILNTGAGRICITNPASSAVSINGGSIAGEVCRAIGANSTGRYVFTDVNTAFTPNGAQTDMFLWVKSFQNTTPPNTSSNAIERYYVVTACAPITGLLCLSYAPSELNGINENDLSSFTLAGSIWLERGGIVNPSIDCITMQSMDLSGASTWTLADNTHPLPIQLSSFTAVVNNGNDVTVSWTTISETNNYGFYLQQRASSSSVFVDVPNSFVPGHGTTLEPQSYSWNHMNVAEGTYYYRLKQVDLDGSINYCDPTEVIVSTPTGVSELQTPVAFTLAQNYPNPFNPSTQIQFTVDKAGFTTLTVFDVLGKEVETLYAGNSEPGKSYSVSFDASGLTNGTYFYKLTNGNQLSMRKMLLLK